MASRHCGRAGRLHEHLAKVRPGRGLPLELRGKVSSAKKTKRRCSAAGGSRTPRGWSRATIGAGLREQGGAPSPGGRGRRWTSCWTAEGWRGAMEKRETLGSLLEEGEETRSRAARLQGASARRKKGALLQGLRAPWREGAEFPAAAVRKKETGKKEGG
jgi:hypothetical protein